MKLFGDRKRPTRQKQESWWSRFCELEAEVASVATRQRAAEREAGREAEKVESFARGEISRIDKTIEQLRGQIYEGRRKRGGTRAEDDVALTAGRNLIAAMQQAQAGDSSMLEQVLEELHNVATGAVNGAASDDRTAPVEFRR